MIALLASMMMFTSVDAMATKNNLKKIIQDCQKRHKETFSYYGDIKGNTCVINYSQRVVAMNDLEAVFEMVNKNRDMKFTLRLSNSNIGNSHARIIAKHLRAGANITLLDIPFNALTDWGIIELIAAAYSNSHIKELGLIFSTNSLLEREDVHTDGLEQRYQKILKISLGNKQIFSGNPRDLKIGSGHQNHINNNTAPETLAY